MMYSLEGVWNPKSLPGVRYRYKYCISVSANLFFHQICAHISPAEQVKYAQHMCTKMCVRNHTYAFERTREIAVRDPNRLTDDASSRSSVSGYPIFFCFFSSLTFSSPRRQQSKSQQSKSQQSKRNTTTSVKGFWTTMIIVSLGLLWPLGRIPRGIPEIRMWSWELG